MLFGPCHSHEVRAADEPKKAPTIKIGKDRDPDTDAGLLKYADMELPAADVLLRSKPFDWIILKTQEVVVVEPVGPRPNTLVKLNSEYERYLKGRAGMVEGEEKLKDRRLQFLRLQITLVDPGQGQDPDYQIETKFIQRIEYFEDLVLQRANHLIDEEKIPLAYDLLLLVDRRNRENNVRLTDAYEARKKEEADARGEEERFRFTLPEMFPLQLPKTWPKFDEVYQKLLFTDARLRSARGDYESAVRLYENLWEHNSSYPDLLDAMGRTTDQLVTVLLDKSDFRQARHFIARLGALDSTHLIVAKWKAELTRRTTALIDEGRIALSQGNAPLAARLVEIAARIAPETPGLKDAHRELIDRYQSVRLGVLRLPGEASNYPFDTPVEMDTKNLTGQLLFEPVRVDKQGVRYRSSIFEAWEPADLGRQVQFTLRLKRADWEARPIITSADIVDELAGKIDPASPRFDERLAGIIEQVSIQSPSQFTVHFRRLPLRLEAFLQCAISLNSESWALNPDIPPAALARAGREKFYEHERDERQVSFRRVHAESPTMKGKHVAEVVQVRYDSWERALQGLLRGEIVGIPRVGLHDLKTLRDDSRFFVVPYALPISHFILFHPRSIPLRDGQLRRALSLALSRQELIRDFILPGVETPEADKSLARPVSTFFPLSSYGHNQILPEPTLDRQRAAALASTARKQMADKIPELRLLCPPDRAIRAAAAEMIESWRRIGISVRLVDDSPGSSDDDWDMLYRTTRIVEPLTDLWPTLAIEDDARIETLRPLPERIRRQLLELERATDWTTATKLLHRIESELLVEARYIPLWEVDEFFVTRRNLIGLPPRLMHTFQDVERWTLQSWYPQEAP